MDTAPLRFRSIGLCVAILTLAGCRTAAVDPCRPPVIPQSLPLRLNVMREVPRHALLTIVVDKDTNQPIENAFVAIDALRTGGSTDANGVALLVGIPSGSYRVSIRRISYVPRHESIRMTDSAGIVVAYDIPREKVTLCNVRVTDRSKPNRPVFQPSNTR